jgi:hypothetical protein
MDSFYLCVLHRCEHCRTETPICIYKKNIFCVLLEGTYGTNTTTQWFKVGEYCSPKMRRNKTGLRPEYPHLISHTSNCVSKISSDSE